MKTKPAPSIDRIFKPGRDRRRTARIRLSCFILVRPFESEPEYFESLILTEDSCRNGLSFQTDNSLFCQRMRLLVTYPYSLHPCAINRDYIAEVVRTKVLTDGRYRVAIRLLTTARLSVPLTSKVHSSHVWNTLWQRV
jgi:hypothetical protein